MRGRTVAGFAIGPVATAGVSIITVPAVAWAFTPEDVGRYNLLQTFVSFAVLFLSLGLDQGYVRQFHEALDLSELAKSAFAPGLLLAAVLALPSFVFARPLAEMLFGVSKAEYGWVAIGCCVLALVARFLSLILRMQERALAFSLSQVIPKFLFLAVLVFAIFASTSRDFVVLESALLASWLGALAVTGWSTRQEWVPALSAPLNRPLTTSLIKYSVPLVFSGLGYWALTASSSLSLRYMSTLRELGVYSVALSFAGAAVVVQSIFSVIWAPVVYRWAASDTDMRRVDRVAQQALALVAFVFVAVGSLSFLVDVVLPAEYVQVKYIVVASIAAPLLYTLSEVTGIGINLTRQTRWSVFATAVALLVCILLNVLLVPSLGAPGAVIANMLAYFAFLIARTEASGRLWRPIRRARLYAVVGSACALAVATVLLGPSTGLWYAAVWAALAPLAAWVFRHEWRTVLKRSRLIRAGD